MTRRKFTKIMGLLLPASAALPRPDTQAKPPAKEQLSYYAHYLDPDNKRRIIKFDLPKRNAGGSYVAFLIPATVQAGTDVDITPSHVYHPDHPDQIQFVYSDHTSPIELEMPKGLVEFE